MGIITKFKTWIFQAKSSENSEDTRLLQTIVSPAKEQVEPQKELSESEQQLLQIKSFIDSDDLSNHELAAMFMQGLEVQLDESMLRAIKRSADKMIFWLGVDDNANFIKSVKELIIGPRFFAQYSEIAQFAEVLPLLTELQVLQWKAKHLWNQHPILIAAGKLPKLKRLYAEDCRMNFLPESLCAAPQLEALYLSGNKLADMPAQLDQLHQLKELDLSNNAFKNCPRSVCRLKLLEVLRLHDNPLVEIAPRSLGRLYKLRDFQLSNSVAKTYLDELKDWLPDVDFEKPYWQI